jgi:hypothetical protein
MFDSYAPGLSRDWKERSISSDKSPFTIPAAVARQIEGGQQESQQSSIAVRQTRIGGPAARASLWFHFVRNFVPAAAGVQAL